MNLSELTKRAAANRKRTNGASKKATHGATVNVSGIKTIVDGIVFGSKAEARYWRELVLRQLAGQISELEDHPKLDLFCNGVLVGTYRPDMGYVERGKQIYSEVKGYMREAAALRIKVAKACGYTVRVLTEKTDPRLWQRERRPR